MPDNDQTIPLRLIINPKYWPTWFGLGLLYACTWLPYAWMLRLGAALGWLGFYLLPARRRITRTNLRLVFPDCNKREIQSLARESFYSASIAVLESAWAWWAPDNKIRPLLHVEGLENLQAAEQRCKGVLMLGGHYTTLEISGRLLAYLRDNVHPTYKPAHNALFEWFMTRGRRRMNKGLIASDDMRGILRTLRRQEIIWYAPDQDFGGDRSVFAPFMGIQASTLTMSARLARASGAPVVPFYSERLPGRQGYLLRFGPMLEDYPGGDDMRDASTINTAIEQQVRRTPAQYLWGHRRFKSRPRGEPQLYPHRRDRPLRRYALVLALLSIPLLGYTLWLAFRNRDTGYLRQRYGFFPKNMPQADLWFHAASVGEVNALLPLLKALHERHPDKRIALTTFTPTGGALARKKLPAGVAHYYLPLDYQYAVKCLLDGLRPRCCIIMETEIWPHLHQHCFNRGIPVIFVNGRVSEKTTRARGWVRHLLGRSIAFAWFILARSETDKQRFLELYNAGERIKVMGNLKFAITGTPQPAPIDLGKSYILAASTHDDEELRLARMWQRLGLDSHYLVIVPRHPHRAGAIMRQLQGAGIKAAQRSKQQAPAPTSGIYLADTFGELGRFIAGADFVFMGGSLVDAGGHNILEVGAQGKAVIFGPSMTYFRDERDLFLENCAGFEVADEYRLSELIRELMNDPQRAQETGERARQVLQARQHILANYMSALEEICPALAGSKSDARSTV